MHYCEIEIQGIVLEECGQPASVKHEGRWYCEYHADALEQAETRCAMRHWDDLDEPDEESDEVATRPGEQVSA
jgi:hypothetical protein